MISPKRKFSKHHLLLLIAGSLVVIAVTLLSLYKFNATFRDAVEDAYRASYYGTFVDPTMNGVADVKRNVEYCHSKQAISEDNGCFLSGAFAYLCTCCHDYSDLLMCDFIIA